MAQRSKKREDDGETYRHETEKRKNVVPVGFASYDISIPEPKKYEYGPHTYKTSRKSGSEVS